MSKNFFLKMEGTSYWGQGPDVLFVHDEPLDLETLVSTFKSCVVRLECGHNYPLEKAVFTVTEKEIYHDKFCLCRNGSLEPGKVPKPDETP